ncbi:stage II sporulation protein M [Amphibacillus sp. MSJ-3]|uniref:stage II sporulation protein M n=1 Tax=Amphibacillus sp. MSJ-3 TaxID=2841505 RepID=UPI001C0E9E49|nr:stage II sporulation protein M [Amphibacillus sp. MSJ-3]MBU5594279.1 stage II sporulation protein M [Amphibacillus sp. MSJ-3]
MRINYQKEFVKHFETYQLSYFFILILFLMGLIFGAIIVVTMHFTQKQDLLFYLNQYFARIDNQFIMANHELFKSALLSHLQYLVIFFVLGLSIIGLPVIWVIVFVKGTFIGFSVGFFVNQYGFKGLLFISSAILPQSIITIPVYLLAGTLAMIFTSQLIKKLSGRRMVRFTLEPLVQYFIIFMILFAICFLGALVEAYISGNLLQYTAQLIR